MGPLFTTILADQFTRLRDGDRFFYLNETFNQDELNILAQGNTLAKVIEANTHITNLQSDVFLFQASISGTVFYDLNGNGHKDRLDIGLPGITVQLLNADGGIVATTKTDRFGNYTFTQLSGPSADPADGPGLSATGTYTVNVVLPPVLKQTGKTEAIPITKGGTNVHDVDVGVRLNLASGLHASGLAAALSAILSGH